MNDFGLGLLVQLFFAFGMAGLLWPDKLMPFYGVLMFPWRPTCRIIRAHGLAAIAAYFLFICALLIRGN